MCNCRLWIVRTLMHVSLLDFWTLILQLRICRLQIVGKLIKLKYRNIILYPTRFDIDSIFLLILRLEFNLLKIYKYIHSLYFLYHFLLSKITLLCEFLLQILPGIIFIVPINSRLFFCHFHVLLFIIALFLNLSWFCIYAFKQSYSFLQNGMNYLLHEHSQRHDTQRLKLRHLLRHQW